MVNQITQNNQLTPQLVNTVQQLSSSLKTIQPTNSDSQTTQLITYTLIATAVVGIFVYHYIKENEQND